MVSIPAFPAPRRVAVVHIEDGKDLAERLGFPSGTEATAWRYEDFPNGDTLGLRLIVTGPDIPEVEPDSLVPIIDLPPRPAGAVKFREFL